MNSQGSPAIATHVTGPNRYALLTKMAPMGAAECVCTGTSGPGCQMTVAWLVS
jgi:hypothetical protein